MRSRSARRSAQRSPSRRLFHRSADAALVLTRLSVYKNVLQATVTGVARGAAADRLERLRLSSVGSPDTDLAALFGRTRPVFGVVHDDILMTAAPGGTATGGPGIYETEARVALPRPADHDFNSQWAGPGPG